MSTKSGTESFDDLVTTTLPSLVSEGRPRAAGSTAA